MLRRGRTCPQVGFTLSAAATGITAVAPPAAVPRSPIEVYRDDGPLARALGSRLGAAVSLPPSTLLLAGAIPLLAELGIGGDGAPRLLVGAALAWAILMGGASSGRPHADRLRWAVPPLLRLVEYASVLWLAALAGPSSYPAAFALLAAVAFRHYDLVYRLRYQGVTPPRWVSLLGGGWDGRLLVGYLLLVTGALPAGFFIAAAVLATAFVGESVVGWARYRRAQAMVVYEDEEDEGH
jgi:hypothetical protein